MIRSCVPCQWPLANKHLCSKGHFILALIYWLERKPLVQQLLCQQPLKTLKYLKKENVFHLIKVCILSKLLNDIFSSPPSVCLISFFKLLNTWFSFCFSAPIFLRHFRSRVTSLDFAPFMIYQHIIVVIMMVMLIIIIVVIQFFVYYFFFKKASPHLLNSRRENVKKIKRNLIKPE